MSTLTGPWPFARAFVWRIDQGINRGCRPLPGIRLVGLLPFFVVDHRRLMPVALRIQSWQLGALRLRRDLVPPHGQFRPGLVSFALPPFSNSNFDLIRGSGLSIDTD
jgi:hypothetical protein